MSPFYRSQIAALLLIAIPTVGYAGKTKNPAYISVSRVRENLFRFFTCLHQVYPNYLRAVAR